MPQIGVKQSMVSISLFSLHQFFSIHVMTALSYRLIMASVVAMTIVIQRNAILIMYSAARRLHRQFPAARFCRQSPVQITENSTAKRT
jgi:hypothetical protein